MRVAVIAGIRETVDETLVRRFLDKIQGGDHFVLFFLGNEEYVACRDGSLWFFGPRTNAGPDDYISSEADVLEDLVRDALHFGRSFSICDRR